MKEIPALFSTSMVMALLHKRKSQTRRIMKPQIKDCDHSGFVEADWKDKPILWSEAALRAGRAYCSRCGNGIEHSKDNGGIKCPYGKTGDVLWVRETHYAYGWWTQEGTTKTGKPGWTFKDFTPEDQAGKYHFIESRPKGVIEKRENQVMGWYKRPAIFMPYPAARIWLQKTDTKVERASDISREDAIAEGLMCLSKDGGRVYKYGIPDSDGLPGNDDHGWHWQEWHVDPVEAFKKLWGKVNGLDTWNNWVWCNSFKILSTTGKPGLNNQ